MEAWQLTVDLFIHSSAPSARFNGCIKLPAPRETTILQALGPLRHEWQVLILIGLPAKAMTMSLVNRPRTMQDT